MRRRLASLAAVLVSACATLPPPSPTDVAAFELSGRVAVRYGAEAASGRAEWRHSAASDDLVISNPIGQGIASIQRREGEYVLQTSDGKRYTARDPEALTQDVLGWRLPLEGLPEWVRGRAMSGTPAETRLDGARLGELRQLGWTIEYLEYGENGLPRRMRLTREDLDIRLVVEEWRQP
jgi:outer membrane lipoprotein LolB